MHPAKFPATLRLHRHGVPPQSYGFNENGVCLKNIAVNWIQELAEISMICKPHPSHHLVYRVKQRLTDI
jgi:hypothetical protein